MRRTPKKLETYTDVPWQVTPENSAEESTVTSADDCIVVDLEKRKKEAVKPLYLKRV